MAEFGLGGRVVDHALRGLADLVTRHRRPVLTEQTQPSLDGYYYASPAEALAAASLLFQEAERSGVRFGILQDLDDVSFESEEPARMRLNDWFSQHVEGFEPVSLREVEESGGRFYQVERFRQAAEAAGTTLSAVFRSQVWLNEEFATNLPPYEGVLPFQEAVVANRGVIVGYATVRPQEVSMASAYSLARNNFARAPLLHAPDIEGQPDTSKVEYLIGDILPLIPSSLRGKIYLLDDRAQTALLLKKRLAEIGQPDVICSLVPRTLKNQRFEGDLRDAGIPYGNFPFLYQQILTQQGL